MKQRFPGSTLTFFEDRDRSRYTFEQRESYQRMRKRLLDHELDILIVKDFSRFTRRNSRGLVEPEDLRYYGARIISVGVMRSGKYTRKKINGKDIRRDESDHIVIENKKSFLILVGIITALLLKIVMHRFV